MAKLITMLAGAFSVIGVAAAASMIYSKVSAIRQDKKDQEWRDRNKLVMDIADQVERRFDRAIRRLENERNSSSELSRSISVRKDLCS